MPTRRELRSGTIQGASRWGRSGIALSELPLRRPTQSLDRPTFHVRRLEPPSGHDPHCEHQFARHPAEALFLTDDHAGEASPSAKQPEPRRIATINRGQIRHSGNIHIESLLIVYSPDTEMQVARIIFATHIFTLAKVYTPDGGNDPDAFFRQPELLPKKLARTLPVVSLTPHP